MKSKENLVQCIDADALKAPTHFDDDFSIIFKCVCAHKIDAYFSHFHSDATYDKKNTDLVVCVKQEKLHKLSML